MKLTLSTGMAIDTSPRVSILESLKQSGIHVIAPCGGDGVCGRCRVIVKEGEFRTRMQERFTEQEIAEGYVAACHTYPQSDLSIHIPRASLLNVEGVIATGRAEDLEKLFRSFNTGISALIRKVYLELPEATLDDNISDKERLLRGLAELGYGKINLPFRLMRELARNLRDEDWKVTVTLIETNYGIEILRISPGEKEKAKESYGLAIDLGTTTIVVYLVYMGSGRLVDIASTYNHQIVYGEDIISRIVYATERGGLKELKEAVMEDINSLIEPFKEQYSISDDNIESIVIAGNTAMTQLFFGLDPGSIRKEPYIPTANLFPMAGAGRMGLYVTPEAPIYALPCVGGYVGGDIVAGVLTAKMHKKEALSVFIDVGTNGELVVGNADWLMTAACSAGPCFEGGGLKHGMRATRGAIDSVKIDPGTLSPEITVIGNTVPEGICGSGIIDAVSEMFLKGIITPKGRFRTELPTGNLKFSEEGPELILYRNGSNDITITEPDIDNILRAKSAIYAGLALLLKEVGLTHEDISTVYIAGGFGRYLNVEKAISIGLLPDQPREKFQYLGNTSVTGAYLCLLSEKIRDEAEAIASGITYMELSVSSGFMDEFIAGLFLPHTDISSFPTIEDMAASHSNRGDPEKIKYTI